MRGSVKWFNQARGYGFIARDDGGPDTFVHLSDIIEGRTLNPGDWVEFEVAQDQRGRSKAIRVRLAGRAAPEAFPTRPTQPRMERPFEEVEPLREQLSQAQTAISEAATDLKALIELLIEKGIITSQEVDERIKGQQKAEEIGLE